MKLVNLSSHPGEAQVIKRIGPKLECCKAAIIKDKNKGNSKVE